MRKLVSAAAVSALIVVVAAAPAQAGGTLSGATSHASATVTYQDVVFDGPGCVEVPFEMTFAKTPSEADNISVSVRLEAVQQGSNNPSTGSAFNGGYDKASGTERGTIYVCPDTFKDSAGPINVTGKLTTNYYVNDSEQTVPLQPAGQLTLVRNATTMSTPKVTKGYSWSPDSRKISGKVTAATGTKGTIGAGGTIELAVKYPTSKKWVGGATTYVDSFGNWSTTLDKAPKGSQIRVSLVDCGWCTDAQKVVKVTR